MRNQSTLKICSIILIMLIIQTAFYYKIPIGIMRILKSISCFVAYQKQGIMKAPQPIIYSIISRTQRYPEFIPFIDSSRILQWTAPLQNYTQLTISYSKFKSLSYTSFVRMQPSTSSATGRSRVYSLCEEAPLKKLESLWQIQGRGEDSFIRYSLNFQFLSPLYTLASSVLKDYMGEQMWNLFEKQSLSQYAKIKKNVQKTDLSKQTCSLMLETTDNKNTLQQFLKRNSDIQLIYESNPVGRHKIEEIHRRLNTVSDYDSKMKYEIKNMILHL